MWIIPTISTSQRAVGYAVLRRQAFSFCVHEACDGLPPASVTLLPYTDRPKRGHYYCSLNN